MLHKPKWSIAKKRLKNLVCEPLRSRVDFHVINYRKAHDRKYKTYYIISTYFDQTLFKIGAIFFYESLASTIVF